MINKKTKSNHGHCKVRPSLTPLPNMNPYFSPRKEESNFISSLEQIEKKVLDVITDVDEKLNYLKTNSKKYNTPEPSYVKKLNFGQKSNNSSRSHNKRFTLNEKIIEQRLEKFSPRKSSLVKLMQSTNSFNLPQLYKSNLMNKLVKEIDRYKKPCIQGMFSEIIKKESIYEAYKTRNSNEVRECPMALYSQACDLGNNPPVPVLIHAQDTSLVLNRYHLSYKTVVALTKAIPAMLSLTAIHLDENGLSDLSGSEILKGISLQANITSFFYTRNEIGQNFIQEFLNLAKTSSMVEMNFKGCKVSGQNVIDLIWSFKLFRGLKKLTLSELNLSTIPIKRLIKVLGKSKISYLDVSWNSIPQEACTLFFEGLLNTSNIRFLDYSWNPITDESLAKFSSHNGGMSSHAFGEQIQAVCKVISDHSTLMHINLSYCQISNISPLVSAANNSAHLIGLHLTGNTCESSSLPANILPKLYPNSAEHFNMPLKSSYTFCNLKQRDLNGRTKLSHNDNIINTVSPKKNTDKHLTIESKEVILSRVLGHPDAKWSENWGVSEHCWVCERWGVYHLIVTLDSLQEVATPDIFYSRSVSGCKLVMKPSFNNWKDIEFEALDESKGEYEVSVVIPAGKHRFLIICDDKSVCVTRKISMVKWNKLLVNEFTMPLRELEISLSGEMRFVVPGV